MTKSLADLPVSALVKEPFIPNETDIKPLKTKFDVTKSPLDKTGKRESKDFYRYGRPAIGSFSRIPIKPLSDAEKIGPKYYQRSSLNL